jgi:nicotinamide riboside transporter PnuC
MIDALEWIGSLSGLLGSLLLALNMRVSKYGWISFLVSNLALIAFSIGVDRHGLLMQYLGFTATSLLGLYRSGLFSIQAPTP